MGTSTATVTTAVTTKIGDDQAASISRTMTMKARMAFLARDELWNHVKPYKLGYEPVGIDLPRTNHKLEVHEVDIHDMRGISDRVSLDRNGFEVHQLHSKLPYEDFFDSAKVAAVYLKEIQGLVKSVCGAKQALPLDAELRCRHASFPTSTGEHYQFAQPSLLTHIDVTVDGAKEIIKKLYPTAADEILKSRIQMVTVWKPLKGPVEDWPLAVCDATSLDPSDAVSADVVYQKVVTENYLVHYSDKQKWFYLDRQEPHEVLVFKAADSEPGQTARCAHGSFDIGARAHRGSNLRSVRESIDARVLVMHAEIDYPQAGEWAF
ncbi:hypothetical protein DL767_001237 [Monosporascus sp. MG133]|nr:hypothetical protein DL767_001237 [Monosporascus sp. MG133]